MLYKNRYFYLPYIIFLLIGICLHFIIGKSELFLWINSYNSPIFDTLFKYITHIGDGLFYLAVIIALLFVSYRYALIAALSYATTALVAQGLKRLVFMDELRPLGYFGKEATLHFVEGVKIHSNFSFPSGHSTTAFSMFLLFALLTKDKCWGTFLFLIAVIIAFSRIYLAQHFLEDVLAGSLIGVSLTSFCYLFVMNKPGIRDNRWFDKALLRTVG